MPTFDNQPRTPLGERIADVEGDPVDARDSPSRAPSGSGRGWRRKKKRKFVLNSEYSPKSAGRLSRYEIERGMRQKLEQFRTTRVSAAKQARIEIICTVAEGIARLLGGIRAD